MNNEIIKQHFIMMSRCQHNIQITRFCLTESCNWKQSAGCDACIKKYHKHLGKTKFIQTQQIVEQVQKFHFDKNIKPHNKALFESILAFLTEIKNQWVGFIEKISLQMANQLGHPYLNDTPYLAVYKKLRDKEYKKIPKEKISEFLAFTQKVNSDQATQKQRKFYHIEADKNLKIIQSIKQGYQKMVQSLHASNIELKNFEMSYKKVMQVNNARKISKAISPLDFSRISKINVQNDRPKVIPQSSRVQSTHHRNQQDFQQENLTSQKQKNKKQIQKHHARQLSIDNQIRNPLNRASYDEKQRQISDRKKKLMSMIDKSTDFQKESKHISQLNFPNLSNFTKQQSEDFKTYLSNQLKETQQIKMCESLPLQKVSFAHRRGKTMNVNTQRQKLQNRNAPKFSVQKDLKNSLQLNDLISSQKMANVAHSPPVNSQKNGDYGKNVFDQLKNFGIDFAEVIFQHTKLPQAPEKRNKYENSPQVKKKMVKVPMAAVQEQLQPSSPLLKRRKEVKNKYENSEFKLHCVENQMQNPIPQKFMEASVKEAQQVSIKANQAQSLALLMEAVVLSTEKAIPILQNALKIAENNYSAAQYLSFLYLQKQEARKCLELCNQYLQRIEYSTEYEELSGHLLNNKGASLNCLGRFSEAIEILQKRVEIAPTDVLHKNLGDAYFGIGIYQKSIFHYQNAIKMNPKSDQALYNLAVCLYIQLNYYNALQNVKRALQLAPNCKDYKSLKQDLQNKIDFSKQLVFNFESKGHQNLGNQRSTQ